MNPGVAQVSRRQFLRTAGIATGALGAGLAISPGPVVASPSLRHGHGLKAGVAKRRVTPPVWVPYLTSSANGTNAGFKGVHCDLFAKALVLDDGKMSIALLAVDSIGYDNLVLGKDRHFTRELRERIAAGTKLRPEAIMLTATHAHSTPETIGLSGFADTAEVKEWLEKHLLDLADTAIEAWQKREPVNAFFRHTQVQGIGRNRRILLKNGKLNRHGPEPKPEEVAILPATDEQLSMLAFKKPDGSPHSTLLNFTAHPVVSMLLPDVCADFPGAATEYFERELKGSVCLFTNGAAGNINSVHVSTNYDDVEQLGRRLGSAAVTEWRNSEVDDPIKTHLACRSTEMKLNRRPCPSLPQAEQALDEDRSPKNQIIYRLAKKLDADPLRAELQAMRVGPVNWLSLPGEGFVETGIALKQAGASFVAGYANGWLGYFPIKRAYAEGGYEVESGTWSRVAEGAAEEIEDTGRKLLKKL